MGSVEHRPPTMRMRLREIRGTNILIRAIRTYRYGATLLVELHKPNGLQGTGEQTARGAAQSLRAPRKLLA